MGTIKDGKRLRYYSNGKLWVKEFYKNGKLIREEAFYEN